MIAPRRDDQKAKEARERTPWAFSIPLPVADVLVLGGILAPFHNQERRHNAFWLHQNENKWLTTSVLIGNLCGLEMISTASTG